VVRYGLGAKQARQFDCRAFSMTKKAGEGVMGIRRLVGLSIVAALCVQPLAHAGETGFVVDNQSYGDFTALRLSPSGQDDWSDDLLGRDVLGRGQRLPIAFAAKEGGCVFDVMATYNDDVAPVVRAIDLCKAAEIQLFFHLRSGLVTIEGQP
jgi:hypothetical protein